MNLFRHFIEIAANTAIIGPHRGAEAELLIAGVKPVGLFVTDPNDADSSIIKKINYDIKRLDVLVNSGQLKKISAPQGKGSAISGLEAHFYCQPRFESDMLALLENHTAWWNGQPAEKLPPLPKQEGLILGYTEADVDLFCGGGWSKKNILTRGFMQATNHLRRRCRQWVLLEDAEKMASSELD